LLLGIVLILCRGILVDLAEFPSAVLARDQTPIFCCAISLEAISKPISLFLNFPLLFFICSKPRVNTFVERFNGGELFRVKERKITLQQILQGLRTRSNHRINDAGTRMLSMQLFVK
jgi:hypothetical protein